MNRKIFISSLAIFAGCIFFIARNSFAQVNQEWTAEYNSPTNGQDEVKAMIIDNLGNIYVTGESRTNTTGNDYATVKYNPAGLELWSARYHSTGIQNDLGRGIAVDVSGNVFVTGSTNISGNTGVINTIKYNSAGVQQWAKQFGSGTAAMSAGVSIYKSPIAVDNSGNIYIGGSSKISSTDNGGYRLIKYKSNGDTVWTRRYRGTQTIDGLGSGITSIKIDSKDNIYVTGKSFDASPNNDFATTIKYDSAGVQKWLKKYNNPSNGGDMAVGIEVNNIGSVYIIIETYAPATNNDYGIIKYDSLGNEIWVRRYNGPVGNLEDTPTAIALDPSGNIYVTGYSYRISGPNSQDYLTLKCDPEGNILWNINYNGSANLGDIAKAITVDEFGNAYVTGLSSESATGHDYATVKYSTGGVEQWVIKYNGIPSEQPDDEGRVIASDGEDNIYVSGISAQSTGTDYVTIKYSQTVGITQTSSVIPKYFSLSQNYPNPFNPETKIKFDISSAGRENVKLIIFNVTGREVVALVDEELTAGTYEVGFNASLLNSGVYFYKLETGSFSQTKKMIFAK